MLLLSSLKKILPTLKALVIPTTLKEKATSLVLAWVESLLKKALNLGLKANSLPQQPVMAALQLVSLATTAESQEPLPEKLTVASRILYTQLPKAWKSPEGPLTEGELLAVLRDGLRLSRSIHSVIQRS
ncbi:MAG: hypothetical protein QE263_04230 [Vampirovibrionales bacterium]|nr:hypothetical protein [Vampirovibrionales bacterium]